ncbi:MAG: galactokinase [Flavobacteriaceae bacterium]|nr:galactokinase [Flavobacteriaceae bacterium]
MDEKYDLVIDSPGRINIIGEHTDYNNGFVLPTAIAKKIQFKFTKTEKDKKCSIYSSNFDKGFSFNLDEIQPSENQWENYLLGVIAEIQKVSDGIKGFDCVLDSTIPIGSGVSSSAALECGLAFGLNELFNLNLTKLELVKIGQMAEHNYVGTLCGIMDQFASVMSKKDHVILLDCQSLDFEYVPFQIVPYKIVLLNTNVSHNLASGEYNIRRSQCEEGVSVIKTKHSEVESLRDVSLEMLTSVKNEMEPIVYQRCLYVVEEINRVQKAVTALKDNDLKQVGYLMYETHDGLQNLYEVSCKELDFLVDFTRNYDSILGSRLLGGGFGGCTINIIHEEATETFIKEVSQAYLKEFDIELTTYEVTPAEGTKIV